VAVAGISFPTDLEKFMPVRPLNSKTLIAYHPDSFSGKAIPFITSTTAMHRKDSPRVLYIEDHEDTRELVTLVLEQRKYEVVTGSTIKTGVALAGSQQFDLYLLDSWLPDGSGLDLCKQIREFDKATPILFYSAAAYEIDRDLALQCGAQAYLIKPSQPSELCNLVSALIESHRRVHAA
jgi:DNA-binding response OmpR family regulator